METELKCTLLRGNSNTHGERERERQELMISKQGYGEMLNVVICVYEPYWKAQKTITARCCFNKTFLHRGGRVARNVFVSQIIPN
jgi:hypothetical protein